MRFLASCPDGGAVVLVMTDLVVGLDRVFSSLFFSFVLATNKEKQTRLSLRPGMSGQQKLNEIKDKIESQKNE